MYWPYRDIDEDDFSKSILQVEKVIKQLGAVYVQQITENETWMISDVKNITSEVTKNVFMFRDEYVRVDKVFFSDKPSLVLEFCDTISGPYEDADPFPYDMPYNEMKLEVKYSVGIIPYPELKERAIKDKYMPDYAEIMAYCNNYIIYNEWENAFLYDIKNMKRYSLGEYYGDPEIALIDKSERFCVVVGADNIGIFDIGSKKFEQKEVGISEWIYSINQEDRHIIVIYENGDTYTFDVL